MYFFIFQIDNLEWRIILVGGNNFVHIFAERLYHYVRLCLVKLRLVGFLYVENLAYGKVDCILDVGFY